MMSFRFDLLIHAANILFLFAYLVRDILWLRLLTVVATICLIPYYYARPEPMMVAIYWSLVFTALNLYWIVRLFLERAPMELSADEQRLCELVFRTISPRGVITLLKLATREVAETGGGFVQRHERAERLMVIYSGRAWGEVEGLRVSELLLERYIARFV